MTDNQFDNFFREKLKDHSAAVPEGLWDKIRTEKDRKPMGFFLYKKTGKGLMVAAIIAGASLIAFEINQYSKQYNTASNTTVSKPVTNSQNSNLSNSIATQQTETPQSATFQTDATQHNTVHQFVQKNKNTQNSFTVVTYQDNSNTPTSNNLTIDQLKSTPSENVGLSNPSLTEEQDFSLATYPTSKHETGYPISLAVSGTNQQLSMVNKQLAANAHDKKFKTIIICPTIRSKSSTMNADWGLEVFASPDYALKSVSANTAPQQYIDKKDSTEQMQLGFSAGLRLVKPLNEHLLLKTGFQYSQVNEKFTYRNENELKTTTVITVRTIIRSPGDTIQVSDTSVLQQIGYSVKTSLNHYRSIDIPLTVGYQFGNDNWKLAVNAGVIFNVSSWYQGEMLDSSFAPVSISKANNTMFKTSIGMGLYSSISIIKKINDNTHLFFEPYFRYNLQNITNEQSPYHQRFHIGGLAIGLRFNLNRY